MRLLRLMIAERQAVSPAGVATPACACTPARAWDGPASCNAWRMPRSRAWLSKGLVR